MERNKRNERETPIQKKKRKPSTDIEKAIKTFKK